MFIPDPGSGFLSIPDPDPRSRGQKRTGSRIRIHNTACQVNFFSSFCIFPDSNMKWLYHIFGHTVYARTSLPYILSFDIYVTLWSKLAFIRIWKSLTIMKITDKQCCKAQVLSTGTCHPMWLECVQYSRTDLGSFSFVFSSRPPSFYGGGGGRARGRKPTHKLSQLLLSHICTYILHIKNIIKFLCEISVKKSVGETLYSV